MNENEWILKMNIENSILNQVWIKYFWSVTWSSCHVLSCSCMFVLFTVGKGCFELPSRVHMCTHSFRFHLFTCLSWLLLPWWWRDTIMLWFLFDDTPCLRVCEDILALDLVSLCSQPMSMQHCVFIVWDQWALVWWFDILAHSQSRLVADTLRVYLFTEVYWSTEIINGLEEFNKDSRHGWEDQVHLD